MNSATAAANPGRALVTLSVVSHGNGAALQALLDSVVRHEQAHRVQLIVTDNLGADLPELGASNWHSLIMLRNDRPQGYARNHNAAFQRAEGDYFCVVNPDVVFVEGILQRLLEPLAGRTADIVAPIIVDSRGRIQDSYRKLPDPLELLLRRTLGRGRVVRVPRTETVRPDWIAGILMLMRRETFAKLGGFDARYHLYFEDVELCTRARLTGLVLMVNTQAHLQHDAKRASRRGGLFLLWHLQSALRFFTSDAYRHARIMRDRDPAGRTRDDD